MFLEKEMLSVNILDVIELKQKNVNLFNSGRNFNALSFRFNADTVLKTATEEFSIKDNCVCYVPARLDYSRISNKDELIAVHFDISNYNTQNIEYFTPLDPKSLSALFIKILKCWNEKEPGYKYRCSALLYEILAECHVQNFAPEISDSPIKSSIDYMLDNYKRNELTIKEIAEKSFMSEVYFRKLFKARYGVSPQKYIMSLRIQNAVELISTGYYSLQEAAYMSGYDDYKYFSVVFKKIKGTVPSKYSYNHNENK